MRELTEVKAIPVQMRGKTFWVRTDIKGNAAKLFKAVGVTQVIKIRIIIPDIETCIQNMVAQTYATPITN